MSLRLCRLLPSLFVGWLLLAGSAPAGGGGERVLVVVNDASPLSRRVAERYCELRDVPPSHVVALGWVPGTGYGGGVTVPLDQVLESILLPVLEKIDQRDLVNEVDTIVYSTGFPYMVDIRAFAERAGIAATSTSSLSGLTFFVHQVLRDDPVWLGYTANAYYRGGAPQTASNQRVLSAEEGVLQRAAYDAYQAKEYRKATELYDQYLATYRDDATSWYNLACCRALLGLNRQAVDALEMSVAAGWSDAPWTVQDKDFAPLRLDARFQELVRVMADRKPAVFPSRGYRAGALWSPRNDPEAASVWEARQTQNGGYFLSTLLGYTGVRGNTEAEILAALEKSVEVEGTAPKGTVYLLRSRDKLTRVRSSQFPALAGEMQELGRAVELLDPAMEGQDGVFPRGKLDVLGAMLGAEDIDFGNAASRMVPGGFCDNSSEWSGAFWSPRATKLSEWLRQGCLFAAGPITESGTFAAKFPAARLYLHYTNGCSAAESYFQSIASPFQMLLVGDPLLAPFSRKPRPAAPVISGPLRDTVEWTLEANPAAGDAIDHLELWADGWWLADAALGDPLRFETRRLADGWHSGRIVAVSRSPIGWRGAVPFEFVVDNHGLELDLRGPASAVPLGEKFVVEGTAKGAQSVEVGDGDRVLATLSPAADGTFRAELESRWFSHGEFDLHATARTADGGSVRARPVTLVVAAPALRAPTQPPLSELPGLRGTAEASGNRRKTFTVANLEPTCNWPLYEAWQDVGGEAGAKIVLEGTIQVPVDGCYELQIYSSMLTRVRLGRDEVLNIAAPDTLSHCAELHLEKGFHDLRIELETNEYLLQFSASIAGAMAGRYLDETVLRSARDRDHPADPKPTLTMGGVYPEVILQDGDLASGSQAIPSGRIEFGWRSTQRVSSVVLYFPPDATATDIPLDWTLERKSGRSWIPISGLEIRAAWDGRRGSRESAAPAWVEIQMPPTRLRDLRVSPAGEVQSLPVSEVEVLVRD